MRRMFILFVFVLVPLLLMFAVMPALAQEPTPPPSSDGELVINIFAAIGGIIAAFAAGGGTVLVVVSRLRSDVPWQNAVERLYMSVPEETARRIIRDIVEVIVETGEVLDIVTDGEPNEPPALTRRE